MEIVSLRINDCVSAGFISDMKTINLQKYEYSLCTSVAHFKKWTLSAEGGSKRDITLEKHKVFESLFYKTNCEFFVKLT